MILVICIMAVVLTILGIGKFLLYLIAGAGIGLGKGVKKIQGETRFFDTNKNFNEWYNENKDNLDNAMTMDRVTKMLITSPKATEENIKTMLEKMYNEQQYNDKQQKQWEEICERRNWKKN